LFGGADPLGRRIRRVASGREAEAPWEEIVGVVADFPNSLQPRMYRPLVPGSGDAVTLAIHVRGESAAAFTDQLRALTLAVDPMLRLGGVTTLESKLQESQNVDQLSILAVMLLTVSVLSLSAAGMYALMSFTITRRRREIGIRSALGAGSRDVLSGVLVRA